MFFPPKNCHYMFIDTLTKMTQLLRYKQACFAGCAALISKYVYVCKYLPNIFITNLFANIWFEKNSYSFLPHFHFTFKYYYYLQIS